MTGGAGGIGRAVVADLARAGARAATKGVTVNVVCPGPTLSVSGGLTMS